MTDDTTIAALARKAARCAWWYRHHAAMRSATICEREAEAEADAMSAIFDPNVGHGYTTPDPGPPCWRPVRLSVGEDCFGPVDEWGPYGGDRDEWCEPCQRCQHHHEEMLRWGALARTARGRLTRALDREAGRPGAASGDLPRPVSP